MYIVSLGFAVFTFSKHKKNLKTNTKRTLPNKHYPNYEALAKCLAETNAYIKSTEKRVQLITADIDNSFLR